MLTQEYLKECLSYDPDTGIFVWKNKTHNRIKPGSIAGSKHIKGYLTIRINRKAYLCHRLAWLYFYGEFPKFQIDHINCIRTDNRIKNLRQANNTENNQNRIKCHSNNKSSGLLGVSFCKVMNKFVARIWIYGKCKRIGYFDDKYDAYNAYLEEKRKYHRFNTL